MLEASGIKAVSNKRPGRRSDINLYPEFLNEANGKIAKKFHETIPGYQLTPLYSLDSLADFLGVSKIFVKDESFRFNLNAFKVLGGSFAAAKVICEKLGRDISEITFQELQSEEVRKKTGEIIFATATDGNHGLGIAWAARQLGQNSIVYMPRNTALSRVDAVRKAGADVCVTELNYDETVELASKEAEKNGWTLMQDTSWPRYEKIPQWIMQGYITMALEALEDMNDIVPTHLFLQAGVGSMAAAVLGYFVSTFKGEYPFTSIIEPVEAACMFESAFSEDKVPRSALGNHDTIMAGLACGRPNPEAWEILKSFTDMFFACPDYTAARGMRILANPIDPDKRVIAGESGAVGLGLLSLIMQNEKCKQLREALDLTRDSVILIFNTEGATDPDNYYRIVWDGKFPLAESTTEF